MIFEISGKSKVTFSFEEGNTKSTVVETKVQLDISEKMKRSAYFNDEDMPTDKGVKSLSQVLLLGLAANIHYAHNDGMWDKDKHLQYVLQQLQEAVARKDVESSKGDRI